MFFFYLNSNPLCYEGLSSLCFPFHSTFGHIFAQNVAIRHHFHTFGHIFANFVAIIPFRSSFERVFPKNVSISRFKLHFGRIFVQNALVLLFHHPFGHTFASKCARFAFADLVRSRFFAKMRISSRRTAFCGQKIIDFSAIWRKTAEKS